MKFACDKCNTRYSIADERVRGRVLKIRCKACNHVITVREEQQPEPLSDSFQAGDEHTMVSTAPPAPREDAADEWFVSFDGDQEGPLPLQRAIDRVRAERPAGRECYCWRTGFFVWLPIEDVPEFAPALAPPKPAPPPPMPMDARAAPPRSPSGSNPVARSTGSHAAVGKATGSNPAPGKITGSNPAVSRSPSGSNPVVGRSPSGSNPAVSRSPSGSHPAIGRSTGSNPAIARVTGSNAAAVGKATGSQAARATGSHPAASKSTGTNPVLSVSGSQASGKAAAPLPAAPTSNAQHGQMAAPAFELPGFESGPLGTPNVAMPSLPTRPEPRHGRREEAGAQPMRAVESGPAVSPFAAALQAGGATQVSDAPSDEINVPRPEQRLDTGPVPLPPPPGDDLPIGEASGLISLSHISKSAMPKPTTPGKSIETFGGVPVMSHSPLPSAMLAAPGAAPRSAPGWMKWAAIAGAMATMGLGLAVVLLLTRKPLVIVVPPAPQIDENKKVDNHPITVADPGPNPNPTTTPSPVADNEPSSKRGNKHARAAKPQTKSGGGDDKLSGEQGKLAALYRDDGEHAVSSQNVHAADRGSGGGNVSQQNILAVATQNRRSLNLCYDRVLKHDSSLKSGRVLVRVKVGISGSVTGVNVPDPQYANAEIGQCLVQTIKHWHFPSADSEYETEFPIILQAN